VPGSSRILINPNFFNQQTGASIPENQSRKFPLEFNFPFIDEDSVSIHLPFGYQLETGPNPCELQTGFAAYTVRYYFRNGDFIYYRRYQLKTRTLAAEEYGAYLDFLKEVVLHDQTKFVFKK